MNTINYYKRKNEAEALVRQLENEGHKAHYECRWYVLED